jgi:hypothetical protein
MEEKRRTNYLNGLLTVVHHSIISSILLCIIVPRASIMFTSLIVLSLLSRVVYAASFPSDGCAAPSSLDSCMATAASNAASCFSSYCPGITPDCVDTGTCGTQSTQCLQTCFCGEYREKINCVLESCWNKVSFFLISSTRHFPRLIGNDNIRFIPANTNNSPYQQLPIVQYLYQIKFLSGKAARMASQVHALATSLTWLPPFF